MEENGKPARVGIASHLREADRKHFCFYKVEVQALGQRCHAVIMREQVQCRCAAHYIQFNFFYN